MPTVDSKNDTDEKHSLSSFDKRKVQSVTFGARQIDRKNYRVVKHEYGQSAKADSSITFKNNSASSYFKTLKAENNANMGASAVSSEVAQRMQRAEYIRQMNNESISRNISSAKYFSEEHVSTENAKSVEMNFGSDGEKKNNTITLEKQSEIPEHQNSISPETALRMKRAAFLAQENKEAIMLNTATVISDETETEKCLKFLLIISLKIRRTKPKTGNILLKAVLREIR